MSLAQTSTFSPAGGFRLRVYRAAEIDAVWPLFAPLIQKALDRGSNYTISDILEGLRSSAMQLWAWGLDAAMVTTIQSDERTRWCLILALGGTGMDAWKDHLTLLDDWAREQGCQELRIYGRPGWKRLGFEIDYAKLVRKL